jgi:hypothetical protein
MTARVQDYPTLLQAIQDYSHNSLLSNYNYFIQFGQFRIQRDIFTQNEGMGVQWMETPIEDYTDPDLGSIPIPSGYLSLKAMQVSDGDDDTFTLLYKDPQWMYSNYFIRQATGLPAYVCRDGSNFVFGPYPDDEYLITGTYYAMVSPVTPSNPTNWMTTVCPELLLAACMLEVTPFLRDPDTTWQGLYDSKLQALISLDKADRVSSGSMTMEVE